MAGPTLVTGTLVTLDEFETYVEGELNVTLNGAGADEEALVEALNLGYAFILSAFLARGYSDTLVATIVGARAHQRNASYHFFLLDGLKEDYEANKSWVDDILAKVSNWIANTSAFFDSSGEYVKPDPTTDAAKPGQILFANRGGTADVENDRLWQDDARQLAGKPSVYGRGTRYPNRKWS